MTKAPPDSATELAWDADRVIAALRSRPAFEFTVGELIWIIGLSQHAAWSEDAAAQAEARRLLDKARGTGEDS